MRGRAAALSHPVVAVGLGLVALQAVFRGWALYPSWFYYDDFRLLHDATRGRMGLDYLLEPFDSQLMPLGRLVAWLVAESGEVNWALAATVTLALQVLAGLAFLWMLVTVFGCRWGVLAPLTVYLSSALTVPAMMWWAASLNQLPLLIAMPMAVGAWVTYLRTRRFGWLAATLVAVAFGFLAYVKTILLVLVLAYLVVALFGTGGPLNRIRTVLRAYWPAAVAFGALAGGYLGYYLTQVPSVLEPSREVPARELAETMLGSSFASGAVGGPIEWAQLNPPVATADPPGLVVALAWLVAVGLVVSAWSTRVRTGRVWILLGLCLVVDYLIVLGSRAVVIGPYVGTEFRYLTESAVVLALCVGLATMPVPGAPEGTEAREQPLLPRLPTHRVAVLVTGLVVASGLLSTVRYVDGWHHGSPIDHYLHNATKDLAKVDGATLTDQEIPRTVWPPPLGRPYNTTGYLLPLAGDVTFPDATDRLLVLDSDGHLRRALIDAGVTGEPGPTADCGWQVSSRRGRTIPLSGRAFAWDWWVRIGYLSSAASPVTVEASGDVVHTRLRPGVNSLYLRLTGPFDRITVRGLGTGVRVCVDTIEVGNVVPGGPL